MSLADADAFRHANRYRNSHAPTHALWRLERDRGFHL